MANKKIKRSVKSYATAIASSWHRSTAAILKVATLCAQANKDLKGSEKSQLYPLLPFSQPTFSKLATIASDPRLAKPGIKALLPPSYSTIYEVTQLSNGQLETAVAKNILRPDLRRADLIRWRKDDAKEVLPMQRYPQYARVLLTKELSAEEMDQLRTELDLIGKTFALKILRPEDFYNERASSHGERILKFIRKEARKIMKPHVMKQRKLRGRPGASSPEEYTIANDMDEQEIYDVLSFAGNEGDLEEIKKRAYREIPMPKQYQYWPVTDEADDVSSVEIPISSRKKKHKFDFSNFT